ncbi:sugar ABC transporter permease [Microbacterium sp. YMB-B2]|uniref:Sugar ABC transporter permease n=1 Tax=Microbacterium tenebrionis TaxID=2830665 RepID=A0A9X1LMR4_9MICO|nr:sugar ABC transporter permease [Microbacterium tenebrionis]MCC2028777.1 sugar ABC transporter permease [Microbacterium tenebrionis]
MAILTTSTVKTEQATADAVPSRPRRKLAPRAFYWFVWPAVIAFALFHTLPVTIGIFFSFTNYAGYGTWDFVGIANYINIFRDDRVLRAYGFSFLFAIVATVITNAISLAIAMGLNAKIKARNFWRGVYFVPYILAVLVVGYVFQFLFSNSLPKILSGIPLFRDNILTSPEWAWTAVVALAVWQACAFSIIIYLAGLQTIPADIYEAASIDGATAARQFRSITFPLISAFFTINVVLSLKGFLQVFDPIIALTNGGPGTSTESVTMLIFRGGFSGGEFAYQTANAVIFFIVITIVSLLQFRVLQRREADF